MYSSTFLDLGMKWRWVVSFTSPLLYHRGKDASDGWATEPVCTLCSREISLFFGRNRTPVVQARNPLLYWLSCGGSWRLTWGRYAERISMRRIQNDVQWEHWLSVITLLPLELCEVVKGCRKFYSLSDSSRSRDIWVESVVPKPQNPGPLQLKCFFKKAEQNYEKSY
jgi:hypothetical protein